MRLGTYYRCKLLAQIGIKATGERVLDVGGYDGYWLSTQEAKNKYVLDINIIKKYKEIKYVKADALKIPFADNYFDQVFAFDVIEHIEERKETKFLSELIRVCKKNGEIILSTPSKAIKLFPSFMTNYISRKWGHNKCNGYSKEELKKMLSVFDNIKYLILDDSSPAFRLLFIVVRFLWFIRQNPTEKIVDKLALYDSRHNEGNEGYYIIKISKNNLK